jgi:hypothetical protein
MMSETSVIPYPVRLKASLARWVPQTIAGDAALDIALRCVVVGCQAATLLITYPLWQVHTSPPMLPALPLPKFDMGIVLLLSLAVVMIKPLWGVALHTILIVYAMLIDQMRIQPEVISLLFLLWGSLPNPNAKGLARAHLIALWCFAGFNKLLSPGFMNSTAQWMLTGLVTSPPAWLSRNFGYVVVATESGTGLMALFPHTRKLSAVVAFGLHMGILLDLSVGHHWNQSVWPWNAALAFAGFLLIAPWKEPPFASWRCSCRPIVQGLVILILISPLGFYVGITDAYLAHNLYSSNVPTATSSAFAPTKTWDVFNVPLPPEHRLFEQWFRLVCKPGDTLSIWDSRWWFRAQGLDRQKLTCPAPP